MGLVGSIIDGQEWTRQRIGHLEAALGGDDLDAEGRAAVEAELAGLRAEHAGSARRRRWWVLLGARRP